jgi:mono/diheme cytochrome c family protein
VHPASNAVESRRDFAPLVTLGPWDAPPSKNRQLQRLRDDRGRTGVFQENQGAYCHAPAGNGRIKLADRSDLEPKYVFETISEGRIRGGLRMPSWRVVLTDEQIWKATAYVMSAGDRLRYVDRCAT